MNPGALAAPVLRAEALVRRLGDYQIGPVSLTGEAGAVVGVLGPNGAGKTTLLRLLAGLLEPNSGRVVVAGFDVVEQRRQALARLGYLPESLGLYSHLTVRGMVRHVGLLKGLRGQLLDDEVDRSLDAFELQSRRDQRCGTLSRGYIQRVGLAQATVGDPRLLILDEPFTGLDPIQAARMSETIRTSAAGRCVVLSTHVLSEAAELCTELLIMDSGRVAAQDTTAALSASPGSTRLVVSTETMSRDRLAQLAGVGATCTSGPAPGLCEILISASPAEVEHLVATLVNAGVGVRAVQRSQLRGGDLLRRALGRP